MEAGGTFLFAILAALAGGVSFWVLREYRRGGGGRARTAVALAALLSLGALALYIVFGRPDLPDQPYAARIAALKARPLNSYSADEMVARLNAEARAAPQDARPLVAAGLVLLDLGRNEEAARAFQSALRRDPDSRLAMLSLGRALVRADQGRVGPQAQALFAQAAAKDPADPTPWLYQALAATQEGRSADARRLWREVLNRLAPDDPRRAMAMQMIAEGGR
ncbi:MAG: tetratricopeptide repeat protein [Hyphomonadaceae bacterium]